MKKYKRVISYELYKSNIFFLVFASIRSLFGLVPFQEGITFLSFQMGPKLGSFYVQ